MFVWLISSRALNIMLVVQKQMALNRKAIREIGMGSWRLRRFVSPMLQLFVANLEGAWRHLIDDLGLYPIKPVRHMLLPLLTVSCNLFQKDSFCD